MSIIGLGGLVIGMVFYWMTSHSVDFALIIAPVLAQLMIIGFVTLRRMSVRCMKAVDALYGFGDRLVSRKPITKFIISLLELGLGVSIGLSFTSFWNPYIGGSLLFCSIVLMSISGSLNRFRSKGSFSTLTLLVTFIVCICLVLRILFPYIQRTIGISLNMMQNANVTHPPTNDTQPIASPLNQPVDPCDNRPCTIEQVRQYLRELTDWLAVAGRTRYCAELNWL